MAHGDAVLLPNVINYHGSWCCPAACIPQLMKSWARHSTAQLPGSARDHRHSKPMGSFNDQYMADMTGNVYAVMSVISFCLSSAACTAHLDVPLSCTGPFIHTHNLVVSQYENHALDALSHLHGEHGEHAKCASHLLALHTIVCLLIVLLTVSQVPTSSEDANACTALRYWFSPVSLVKSSDVNLGVFTNLWI